MDKYFQLDTVNTWNRHQYGDKRYIRKCRTNSKPQQQVCYNGTDLVSGDEREVISEYKKTHHPKLCPPTSVSTAAECSVDQIYENICCSRGTANSKHSAANVQEKHNSTMCRTPLPPKIPERSSDGAFGKRTNKPTTARNMTSKPKKGRASNASASLISVKPKTVVGVEGQSFDFRCEYKDGQQNNSKYFCYVGDNGCVNLIRTEEHTKSVENGRFSLHDNTSRAFFIVTVDKLTLKDSRTYWCGVDIHSNPDENSVIHLNVLPELHMPLYLTAVMCVSAIFIVCLFTLCLLLAVKHRRSGEHRLNRETSSSDYETMMPGVRTEPEICNCSDPNCTELSAFPSSPPDLCSHFTPKHRESTVTLGVGEYVDVLAPGCPYQHLDLGQLEDHVYHSLHEKSGPKDRPPQIN
ncbi:CMRF35-like molecule 9 [Collichthys lucidus]|uniref:CMRF35-like molecule 9 n=1 Tax=Collichthys lucidus TaxID=240159 RepID=A0A4U5U4L6_COLLU|nr:CMRF35-like molecule 9 [Collichthys lucidus]